MSFVTGIQEGGRAEPSCDPKGANPPSTSELAGPFVCSRADPSFGAITR